MVIKSIIKAAIFSLLSETAMASDKGKLTERNTLGQMSAEGVFDLETDLDTFKRMLTTKPKKVVPKIAAEPVIEAVPEAVAPVVAAPVAEAAPVATPVAAPVASPVAAPVEAAPVAAVPVAAPVEAEPVAAVNTTTAEANATEEAEDSEKSKSDYVNSKLSIQRANPSERLYVHLMPYSLTAGFNKLPQKVGNPENNTAPRSEGDTAAILNSVMTELMNPENVNRTFSFMDI